MKTETVKLPSQRFEAFFQPKDKVDTVVLAEGGSPDRNGLRSCPVTWYTGSTVDRFGWDGPWRLTLSMDPAHVRMGRLNSGRAPLLNNHSNYTLSDVIGRIDNPKIVGTTGTATAIFSNRPEVDGVWQDIQDGIVANASVGARIYALRDVTEPEDKLPSFLAIDWEPQEVSVVPIGADPNAGFSNKAKNGDGDVVEEFEVLVERPKAKGEQQMETTQQQGAPAAAAAPDVNAIRTETLAAERKRQTDIKAALRAGGLQNDEQFAATLLDVDVSIEVARERILNKLAENGAKDPTRSGTEILRDEKEKRADAITNALLHRYSPSTYKLEAGREFRSMTLMEMAKDAVSKMGKNPSGMSLSEVARLALRGDAENFKYQGTTDFPGILANVSGKVMRDSYEAEPQTFKAFSRMTTANDFKPMSRVQLGDTPTLELVNPSGEFKYGAVTEAKESYQLQTFGKIIAINRQTVVNDDLDAFTRIPASQGRAAARLESDVVWSIITSNPNMADGNPLFSNAHNNLVSSGTVIAVASLGAARGKLRTQQGLGGVGYLNLDPKYLLVPTTLETIAGQYVLLTGIVPTTQANINPFAGQLTPVSEPRLDANSLTAWYLFADPNRIDTIEYAYLAGQEGVYQETRMGFEVDGIEMKARLDFGAKAIDWRGMVKNVGA